MFAVKVSNFPYTETGPGFFHSSHLPLDSHFTYLFGKIKLLNTLSLEQIKVILLIHIITTYKQYINIKIVGRNGMGRNCHGPILTWADLVMGRNDQ